MVNAPHATVYAASVASPPAYDEQIIARRRPGVQPQDFLWFPAGAVMEPKDAQKRAAVSGGFKVDNREASNRVDRSHSMSKQGQIQS